MNLIDPQVEAYAERFTKPEGDLLQRINQATQAHPKSHMLSGRVQGKFLELLSTIMRPRRILEIGTFTGYSALFLAKGLAEDGVLHTIELREAEAEVARANFNLSEAKDKIILHTGEARDIIPALKEDWDLVFIDADKTGYLDYYKMLVPALKKGAVVLADNVLFHGQVFEEPLKSKNAIAIQAFNEYVLRDASVDQAFLTIRDGLLMIVKK